MIRYLSAEIILTLRVLFRQPGFWIPTVIFPRHALWVFWREQWRRAMGGERHGLFRDICCLGRWVLPVRRQCRAGSRKPLCYMAKNPARPRCVPMDISCSRIAGLYHHRRSAGGDPGPLDDGYAIGRCGVAAVGGGLSDVFRDGYADGNCTRSISSARAAVPVANLVYLPLAYLGGLWVPPVAMPATINAISEWTPTRAMGELGWAAVTGAGWDPGYLLLLLVWTIAAIIVVIVAQKGAGKVGAT